MTARPPFLDDLGRDLVVKRRLLTRRRRNRRAVVGGALAVLAAGIWSATVIRGGDDRRDQGVVATGPSTTLTDPTTTAPGPTTATSTSVAPSADLAWQTLPDFSLPTVTGPLVRQWLDDAVFVWSAEGAWIVSTTDATTTTLPPPPVPVQSGAIAVWTGVEVVVVGGWDDEQPRVGAVSFDPSSNSWRVLPDSPVGWRRPLASVWTGTEVLLWGDQSRTESAPRFGAAYNPATDTWRRIADAPLGLNKGNAVWTGDRMIVIASDLDGNNATRTDTQMLSYDPAADEWTVGPPPPLVAQAAFAVWAGELVGWDYLLGAAVFDTAADAWRPLSDAPLRAQECYPSGAAFGRTAVMAYCGQYAALDLTTLTWRHLPAVEVHGGAITAPGRLLHVFDGGAAVLVAR